MGYLPRLGYLRFYSHVNYSVTKIQGKLGKLLRLFYSHVNYSVTKIESWRVKAKMQFYSHVNYSVTKMGVARMTVDSSFTVT